MKKIPLIAQRIARALLVTATIAGARPAADEPVEIVFWHAQTDSRPEDNPRARREVQQDASRHRRARSAGLERRRDGAEAAAVIGSDNYPDIAYVYGSDVPPCPNRARSSTSRRTSRRRASLEQPVSGGSQHGDGRREGRRLPRRDRQPRGGLQQEAAQGRASRRRSRTGRGTTIARSPRSSPSEDKAFGTGFPISGSEDTVWRLWPMIWQQGGEVLDADDTKARSPSPQGVKALQLLTDMARQGQVALPGPDAGHREDDGLFDSGKMA